jgi:hypothetical protein
MNYTQKLTLSMVIPTVMVAGAGSAVVVGAMWLKNQALKSDIATLGGYLEIGGTLTAVLTAIVLAGRVATILIAAYACSTGVEASFGILF